MTPADVDELAAGYHAGRSLPDLARDFDVHRRTIAAHLEERGVHRCVNPRKMSDKSVTDAALRYLDGDSLATLAKAYGVHAETIRRQLARVGVAIRTRPRSSAVVQ